MLPRCTACERGGENAINMTDIRWGPWAGACRRSSRGHRLPPTTHSTWSLDDDLGQLQKVSQFTTELHKNIRNGVLFMFI